MKAPEISLVIPCHNEQDNLQPLLSAIHATMDPLGLDFEVVITDDCSTDNSWSVLKQLSAHDRRLRVQRFKLNCGESAASWAGMQVARGRYIATLEETTGFELFLHGLPTGSATNSPAKRLAMQVARIVYLSANASPT